MYGRDRPNHGGVSPHKNTRAINLFPAAVKMVGGNKWGYINAKGEFVLPAIYDDAADFQEDDLAVVRYTGHNGLIDTSGYFIVKPKYDTINPFSEGRSTVIDHQGFKVIDESGKEITAKAYSYISDYKEGRALFADTNEQGQYLYGYLNRRGKEVLPLEFESASDFNEGKAVVKLKNGSFALIGLTGTIIKKYPYAFVGNHGEGLLSFQKTREGKFGYIDEQGNIVMESQFSGAMPFKDDRAIVIMAHNHFDHYGLISRSGQMIIKPNYNNLIYLDEKRFALGKAINPERPYIGSKYAVADSAGHILTGFIYNGITKFEDGLASAFNDEQTFFIDKSGKRAEHFPVVNGSGTFVIDKTLIKGEIDFRLLYLKKEGQVVWKQNTMIPLDSQTAVIEHKYKPNKDYLVYYPQISGMEQVNQMLRDLAGIKEIPAYLQLESNYVGDFELTFYKKKLLVIEITGYNYPFGAAHGMPVKKYAHINLETGDAYQLKDLFMKDSDYVKVIRSIIGEQIKTNKEYSYVFPGSYKGIQADQPFFISEAGLTIFFAPYDIAPYAAGFPTFTIPFSLLNDITNHEGGFWKSFH